MGQMSLACCAETRRGREKEGSSGHPCKRAQILRTAGWIPAALALRSLHAGGLWAVINDYPMASIKAEERAQWDTLTLREGLQKEGRAISSWARGDRKCLGMPWGTKKEMDFFFFFALATPLVMIVLTEGKVDVKDSGCERIYFEVTRWVAGPGFQRSLNRLLFVSTWHIQRTDVFLSFARRLRKQQRAQTQNLGTCGPLMLQHCFAM